MALRKPILAHFVENHYHAAHAAGIRGTWASVDQIGLAHGQWLIEACRHYPDWRYILFIYLNDERVYNRNNAWDSMRIPLYWAMGNGIHHQCLGIQFGDEYWSHSFGTPAWEKRFEIADELAKRADELRAYWSQIIGTQCPPIGMSETGYIAPPQFRGQEWWALDAYLFPGLGQYYETPEAVRNVYNIAWTATSLPIVPVIPMFKERGLQSPPVNVLASTYLPIIESPRSPLVGVFAFNPPATIDGGMTTMDSTYSDGLRWLHQRLNG